VANLPVGVRAVGLAVAAVVRGGVYQAGLAIFSGADGLTSGVQSAWSERKRSEEKKW
jgi:hypothetical protein